MIMVMNVQIWDFTVILVKNRVNHDHAHGDLQTLYNLEILATVIMKNSLIYNYDCENQQTL